MNARGIEELGAELRGQSRWTEAQGRRVVDAWERSGESGITFGARVGLVPRRLYWWRDRLAGSDAAKATNATSPRELEALVPMTVRWPQSAAAAVVIAGAARIEIAALDATSAAWVASLVRSLGEST